jgi:hypothetical protein
MKISYLLAMLLLVPSFAWAVDAPACSLASTELRSLQIKIQEHFKTWSNPSPGKANVKHYLAMNNFKRKLFKLDQDTLRELSDALEYVDAGGIEKLSKVWGHLPPERIALRVKAITRVRNSPEFIKKCIKR